MRNNNSKIQHFGTNPASSEKLTQSEKQFCKICNRRTYKNIPLNSSNHRSI